LPSGGKVMRQVCGRMMKRRLIQGVMPTANDASRWP
jgi:hypothetical protein